MTYQTQQLTTEFEKQSQYIVCLLAELQQKDSAFLSLEAELQHCKQEFELLKFQREEEENNKTFEGDGQQKLMGQEESSRETFELHHSEEKQGTVTCDHDRLTPISDNETWSDVQHVRPIKMNRMQRRHDRDDVELSQDRATADLAGDLLKHQDKPQNQSPKSVALPCLAEPRSLLWPRDITAKGDLQIERSCDLEQGDLEREDEAIEGELQAACDLEINHLQEQVCNLFTLDESFPLQTCFFRFSQLKFYF